MRKSYFFLLLAVSQLFSYSANDYSHLFGMSGFTDELLQIHFKLYEGYVKNTNDLLVKLETIDPSSYEFGALKRRLNWEFDGMRLHELYFENLGGSEPLQPKDPLYQAIEEQFGSFEKWKKDFLATGMIRGIGWVVLYLDLQTKKILNVWINEHDLGHLAGGKPILVMDVFEHAYMVQYKLDKAKYLEAFFKNIDWKVAAARYAKTCSQTEKSP